MMSYEGTGIEEVPDFIPIRYELKQLVKHYCDDVFLDRLLFAFLNGQVGGDNWARLAFTRGRLGRIAQLLGDEEVDSAIEEVHWDCRQRLGEDLWEIFANGDLDQWVAARGAAWRAMDEEICGRPSDLFEMDEEQTAI